MSRFLAVAICCLTVALSGAQRLRYRWVYLSKNLLVDSNVQTSENIMRRAKAAGYNGIVFADYKLEVLDLLGENTAHYLANLKQVLEVARSLNLEVYPCLSGPGYASGILAHDANLAEGPPVKDARFLVKDGFARLIPDPNATLRNADFARSSGDKFLEWTFQDGPGQSSFADKTVKHDGVQSVRMENFAAGNPSGNCRIVQSVTVRPWRLYHISFCLKSEDFKTADGVRCAVLTPAGKELSFQTVPIEGTKDWTQYDVVFDSLDNSTVNVYFGVWQGTAGRLWWDDCSLEEAGMVNLVRRAACPLTVTGDSGRIYKEGVDFAPVSDPKMGAVPWPGSYDIYHAPPSINILPGSRIKEGEGLNVSFYTAKVMLDGQVASSMIDPEYGRITKTVVQLLKQWIAPSGYFAGQDEIRCEGWDLDDAKTTPGAALASNIGAVRLVVQTVDPGKKLFVWSDMFDPNHNAVDNYYLVNGSYSGSWKGLTPDMVVVNWNSGKASKSLAWFQSLGVPQILAGYYDSEPGAIKSWLGQARDVNIVGVMYTTWQNNYDDLESFAKSAWGN